ncbi:MAG: SdrD B-like domain-containing protein [Usitatibacter sp.]
MCGVSSVTLNVGETRAIFVRVTAPAGALATDPADVATLTATVAAAQQVTDSTTITTGLVVLKEQQALGTAGCAANNPPAASYSQGAIAGGPSTIPGACIAYRVTVTNATAAPITGVTVADPVPVGTRMHYACSGNGVSTPSTTLGAMAGTTPADNASGTVTANVGVLAAGQSSVLYFCAQVNAATAPGSVVANQATGSGTQAGNPTTVASNTTSATVGAPAGSTLSALLAASTRVNGQPGATIFFRHTLTNTGTVADTYTVTATDTGGGWTFGAVALFPDANGDGQPDSATPLANPIALAPGQVAQFVLRVTVPVSGFTSSESHVRIDASSAGGAAIASIVDSVTLPDPTPRDCAMAEKTISRLRGPSPNPLLNVRITYSPCTEPRSKLFIADALPAGMRYIPGSGRWSVMGATPLTDGVVGDDRQGAAPQQITYDFNVTAPNTVTAWIYAIPANAFSSISFNVEIDAGLAIGTAVTNTAEYTFYGAGGAYQGRQFTSTTYTVDGTVDLALTGAHVPSAAPGTTVAFTNVLTNRGTSPDTFDVTLGASTFPAGVTLALFKPDGVTPLADTDGDGTPDTGLLAPGASYNIVVKATLPDSTPPGTYKVTKTARSALAPTRSVSVDDVLDAVSQHCSVSLDPDNQALIGHGQHVTYTHFLTNRGNCQETVRAMLGYLGDSTAGWTSAAYIDNRVAGAGSLPGVVDATDVRVAQGWSQVLQPGESLRVLVDVHAPGSEAIKAARKQLADSNVTTLSIQSTSSGTLAVKDTTLIDAEDVPAQPDNVIRNFTDSSYATPTFWGVIGRDLFLRADAASCNADPTAAESRTVVLTGANGEREELTAVESGPNTGVFVVPALHVRAPPVVAGDGVVEGAPNDSFDFEILGCGRRIASVVTLMQPASVVFDSRSNDPIAGATVTLVAASGSQCSATPVSLPGASNPAVTGLDGVFSFPAAPGDYCLAVKPPNGYRFPSQVSYTLLSPARNLNVTGLTSGGSYGNAFHSASGIVVDIPLDTAAQDGLFVQKEASKQIAELGDFVDYTVRVRNGTGNVLDRANVVLADNLPAGFAYVKGTARRDGAAIADPVGGGGPRLTLALGHLDRGAQAVITYRVRIGPGAMQGDGVNQVQATYSVAGTTTASNVASAKVQVTGGVFSDKGFILGKVFMDCNANGVQDRGEEGVPGVRVILEDGTYIVTDGAGKFSFYGLANRTHVAKVDRATLPSGAALETISSRNLGDAGSRIVDLKAGELARADFAIAGCDPGVADEVHARAKAVARTDELTALAGAQLLTEARVITDVKALPASGVVEIAPSGAMPGAATPTAAPTLVPGGFSAVMPAATPQRPTPAPQLTLSAAKASEPVALEALVPAFADNDLAFVGLSDGQTLPYAQSVVRVKGAAGTTFKLEVNGAELPDSKVGKRSVLAEKQVQAWEFVGVGMKPGENTLVATQLDSFGNARGNVTIKVIAPDKLGKLVIEVPAAGGIADGKTPVKVVVKLADANDVPVTVRTAVTLAATRGIWQAEDLDPKEPGVQVFVEGGRGEFLLTPPIEPGESRVYAASGPFKAEARLDFLPELRNMIATGVIEGIVNMRNISTRALTPARASDGFEQELRQMSREWNAGKADGGVRAAFYLKGKIKGEYLLTAAYDSDKDTQERLFRDIQPDEFYPVYGDSAVRGFDAQSTSKLYVRVDKGRSYLLWGDFNTNSPTDARKLSNYSRSLTGLKEHYENERMSVNAFASRDTTRQVIEELRANGTSGPFQLSTPGALVNSEKIEILTRDRNQPAIIVSSVPQARFSDYEIEALTGRILFKAPIASVDSNLNPVSVRITYEVDQGGPEFWVAGIDAQVKLGDRIEVGGTYVKDKNPLAPFTLAGADMVVRLGAATYVIAEAARSTSGLDDLKGNAGRLEIKHDSKDFKAQAYVARTDVGFVNPGSYLTAGRGEAGGKLEYKLSDRATIRAEALRTEDLASNSVRDGATASIQYKLADKLTLELGVRHASEKGTVSPVPALPPESSLTGLATSPTPVANPGEVDSVRARVTGEIPGVAGATVYGEAEVNVRDASQKIVAAGGEYQLPNKGRIYARHEFISSITGPYGLNPTERQNTTAVGIDTEYMKDGRAYSEYRIRDAISGGDTEAAFGLKNLWSIAPGLRLGTTLERVHTLAGTGVDENTAVALALEYTANPDWKASTRLELRDGQSQDQILFTVGLAARINRDWTALARNAYTLMRNKTGDGEHLIDRMQAGLAWRDNDTNQWNMLARVESRVENDNTQTGIELRNSTQIVSVHADWQPRRPFLVTARYAAKWSQDKSNGLSTRYRAQVVGGRFTWEIAPKWDVGLVSSALFGTTADSRQYGVGLEVGYLVATNLWVSAGYNFFGYKDADLAGTDYTAKGAYVRLRYKFDENVFGAQPPATAAKSPAASSATAPATVTSESREGLEVRVPETAPAGGFVPLAPGGATGAQPNGSGPL